LCNSFKISIISRLVLESRFPVGSSLDGIRITIKDGCWLLVRPSGTEPVVRIYAEAFSKEKVLSIINRGVEECRAVISKLKKKGS
ncbi:MAG: hypothetical protein ACQESB_05915, partial [Elusimicrobiota bacterium]